MKTIFIIQFICIAFILGFIVWDHTEDLRSSNKMKNHIDDEQVENTISTVKHLGNDNEFVIKQLESLETETNENQDASEAKTKDYDLNDYFKGCNYTF